jgi:DNA-binding response OmpR family regulator
MLMQPATLPASGAQLASGETARVRVLIVDDDADFKRALATLLDMMGYEVRTAQDGLHGLDTIEAFRPQCAVLDVDLPGVDGVEIARRLRRQPWGRDIVLIAMTGWSRNEDRAAAMLAGFDHFLAKPVNLDELFALLPDAEPPRPEQH